MVKILKNTLGVILITSLLASCAAIPANKIELKNYPEIKKEEIKNLSFGYSTFKFEPDRKGYEFDKSITSKIDQDINLASHPNCIVRISTMHSAPFPRVCIANYFLAGVTLFIIPYYCQHTYEAKATLISTKDNKILKEYYLKDKVHEVWSLLWMLSWLVVEPNKYSSIQNKYLEVGRQPEVAKIDTEEAISEALVRSILNDASNLEECRKK